MQSLTNLSLSCNEDWIFHFSNGKNKNNHKIVMKRFGMIYKNENENNVSCKYKYSHSKKHSVPGLRTWSPTVLLAWLESSELPRSDGIGCIMIDMTECD